MKALSRKPVEVDLLAKPTAKGYKVVCTRPHCGWTGRRRGEECCCYDEFAMYCRRYSPGPGCPAGVEHGCPRCAVRDLATVWSFAMYARAIVPFMQLVTYRAARE